MVARIVIALVSLLFSTLSLAFPCYLTLAKDSCWTNYDVTMIVLDANTNQQLLSVVVPKGKSWTREPFTCQPEQKLMYQVTFKPTIWQGQEDKKYMALRYWFLPAVIKPDESAWELKICYPADFAEVPLPATANANCHCDFTSIPAIPPKIEPRPAQ